LLCGCLAIYFLFSESEIYIGTSFIDFNIDKFIVILFLISLSLILDFLDGLVARKLNVQSEIGKQLDSLADVVSFGVLPGFLLFLGFKEPNIFDGLNWAGFSQIFNIFGLLIPLASAYRLAKFNIDNDQSTYFKGLATPAMTIAVVGILWLDIEYYRLISTPFHLAIISILLSFLMISNIPMFSFKMKSFGFNENWFRYILILVSIPLLFWFNIGAFALIIPIYIILSLIARKSFVGETSL